MTFQLQTLLDLRRNAEKGAHQALELAMASRRQEEEEQASLMARWQEARATLAKEDARLATSPSPTTAAQATARAQYLRCLYDEASRLASIAEAHRTTALAAAKAAAGAAQGAYEDARKACEAVEKLKERSDAEDAKRAERRAEDSAGDLAQAMFVKRRSE